MEPDQTSQNPQPGVVDPNQPVAPTTPVDDSQGTAVETPVAEQPTARVEGQEEAQNMGQ